MSKISRNHPCPCGSGKKYKHCCQLAHEANASEQDKQRQALQNTLPQLIGAGIHSYQTGQIADAQQTFQTVLQINPNDPDGLHLLGVIARDQGYYENAIQLINKAIQVLPHEANFYNNLGISYRKNGDPDNAALSYEKALTLQANHAQALNNLGNLYTEQKAYRKAADYFERAIAADPLFAEAHFNLGHALQTQDQHEKALACYQQALNIRPDYVAAISNCGTALHTLDRIDEALAYFEQAITLQADFHPAYMNLGYVALTKGMALEALPFLQHAHHLLPDHPETLNFLSHTEKNLGLFGDAIAHSKHAFHLAPNTIAGLESAVRLALMYYLQKNHAASNEWLSQASGITQHGKRPARTYWTYLGLLLSWWKRQPPTKLENNKIFYVIGDSHTLSLHGLTFNLLGQHYQGQALWVEGCKQWHLGNPENNVYKLQFEAYLADLPINSAVLICAGEIDCRLDEGLLKACKRPEDLQALTSKTIADFIRYISNLRQRYPLNFSLSAIPACNLQTEQLPHDQAQQLLGLIQDFNQQLKQQTLQAEMGFLDIFALTNTEKGKADGDYHIDQIHLQPIAYAAAFSKHFTAPAYNLSN